MLWYALTAIVSFVLGAVVCARVLHREIRLLHNLRMER